MNFLLYLLLNLNIPVLKLKHVTNIAHNMNNEIHSGYDSKTSLLLTAQQIF